ncbi:MAG: hypothetical protein LCH86_25915 [Proteobacteria bacterium]|nr:hypothetical protein [Pseudomonadota bacterium]
MSEIIIRPAPPQPAPKRVTRRQFRLQLLAAGFLENVEAWVVSQSPAIRLAYEDSGTFVRSDPMMQTGFSALGFTEPQIDAFLSQPPYCRSAMSPRGGQV